MAAQPSWARKARRGTALAAVALAVASLLNVVTGSTLAQAKTSPGATTRVSVHEDGSQVAESQGPNSQISGNGRFVVFSDYAPIDPLDRTNDTGSFGDSDIYVRDRIGGHTTLISRGRQRRGGDGTPVTIVDVPANGGNSNPSISADGRYVAFDSTASNLDLDGNGDHDTTVDVYVCDRDPDNDGIFDERTSGPAGPANGTMDSTLDIRCISVGRRPRDPAGVRSAYNYSPSLSADGSTVAWNQTRYALAHPTVEPFDGVVVARLPKAANGDLLPIPAETPTVQPYLNLDPAIPGTRARGSFAPLVSGDGRSVAVLAFLEPPNTINLTAVAAVPEQALVEVTLSPPGDLPFRQVGTPQRLDLDENGNPLASDLCCSPSGISFDGSKVAFSVSPPGFSGPTVARVTDRDAPGGPKSVAVSLNNSGTPDSGSGATLSADGRYVAFVTSAANMHNGFDDTISNRCNNEDFAAAAAAAQQVFTCADVVVRDLVVDEARAAAHLPSLPGELVSTSLLQDCGGPAGESCEGDSDSDSPSLSDDGALVAFVSNADDLITGDTNHNSDVFVREFQPTVAGDPVDFGTVELGSSGDRTAEVRHAGFGPLLVDSAVLGGPDAGSFAIVAGGGDGCTGTRLFETGSCHVLLRFTPTTEGARHATLVVTPHGRPPVTLDLTGGVGVPPDGFGASPNPVAFGQRLPLSPSGPGTVTISNVGRLPLTITSVTRPGGGALFPGDYAVSQNLCQGRTLPPLGGSCTLQVTFTSHGSGARTGQLLVTTVQQGTSTPVAHVVALTGSSPTPTVLANPGVVVSGRVTTISGLGFAPNHAVVLTISELGTVTAQTGAGGSFDQPLVVFRHSTPGNRTVDATLAGTTTHATGTLLIVNGTYQAPDFATRR